MIALHLAALYHRGLIPTHDQEADQEASMATVAPNATAPEVQEVGREAIPEACQGVEATLEA